MIERYAPKAKQAVQQMREIIRQDKDNKGMFEVLDNAEYYIADAERFLRQAKYELAVLSIGYAEGLVDALRFQKGINPWNPGG
jgi:diphthine synthase